MTLLAMGLSHRSAPLAVLDSVALSSADADRLAADLVATEAISEAIVLTTCNRVEVYAEVNRFHPAVTAATDLIAKWTGLPRPVLAEHLYVHFDGAAVTHLFEVASGMDSMVVGEAQILGQVRDALCVGQDAGTAGRSLNGVTQRALRVGKRVRSETGVDRSGASVVSVALDAAEAMVGPLSGLRVLVVGAGSMGSLAIAGLLERGVTRLAVSSRTQERAFRVGDSGRARVVPIEALDSELAATDVAVFATGSLDTVLTSDRLRRVRDLLGTPGDLLVVDLALPHDVDPSVTRLPGVSRIDLGDLAQLPSAAASQSDVAEARQLVVEEAGQFLAELAGQQVEPVLISLRAHVGDVLDAEMRRLRLRLAGVDEPTMAEVERAMRRAMATLLHNPTVRMKELAAQPGGDRYAEAISALFDLDPAIPQSVSGGGQP